MPKGPAGPRRPGTAEFSPMAERAAPAERRREPELDFQDPHGLVEAGESSLERAIGHEVREFRRKLDMTVAELAKLASLSAGMLSKIENGMTSPSLATLRAL